MIAEVIEPAWFGRAAQRWRYASTAIIGHYGSFIVGIFLPGELTFAA